MIDTSLLRIMKHRDQFYKVWHRVPKEAIDPNTYKLLTAFDRYFTSLPKSDRVDLPVFMPMFFAWHPKLTKEHRTAYSKILKNAKPDVPEAEHDAIMHSLLEVRLGADLAKLAMEYNEGEISNLHRQVDDVLTNFRRDAQVKSLDFLRPDIGELLNQELDGSGIEWRLQCLRDSMRGLRPGEFGIVAGRPDRGKTTFMASEMTFMAPQLPKGKTIVWLNNEGPGTKIYSRLYQAALGIKVSEMVRKHQHGHLETEYLDAMGGEEYKIRVFDIHGMDTYSVERIIENNNAGIVVFDMIDNVRGFKDAARTDLALEEMYKWAREMCVKYECIGIATSQISVDGDGQQYPPMSALKDSKTGKQGACDFIIMIGSSNDVNLARVRYIGVPKNKNRREGFPGDPRAAVDYQPEIARYSDVPVDTEDEDDDT